MLNQDQVREALREVIDPEIGINLVDLDLIKEIVVNEDQIIIKMVLTFPGCPLASYLTNQAKEKAHSIAEGRSVSVVVLDEPWTPPWLGVRSSR